MRHTRTRYLGGLGLLVFSTLLPLAGAGCSIPSDRSVIQQANSTNQELSPAIITDPVVVAYFQKIGGRIIAAAKQLDAEHVGPKSHFAGNDQWMFGPNIKFHLVNSKTLNAFTTGGDHVYIYNSLFQLCRNEDELAAVMSHEYAHIYCRHVPQGMQRGQIATLVQLAGAGAGYLAGGKENGSQYAAIGSTAAGGVAQFANMGFTRGDEDEADKYGFMFYTRAGWDPKQFADFFSDMIAKGYDTTPQFLSDHPTLANRVKATQRRISELPASAASWRRPEIADVQQFHQYQARAAADAKHTPTDTSLANSQKLAQALPRSCIVGPTPAADEMQARKELAGRAQKSKPAGQQ